MNDIEVPVERTLWERIIDKLFPAPWAAEERAALMLIAKRVAWKNELYEKRAAAREVKEKERLTKEKEIDEGKAAFRVVATYSPTLSCNLPNTAHSKGGWTPCRARIFLHENKKGYRKVELREITKVSNGQIVSNHDKNSTFKFIKSTAPYLEFIQPWLDWVIHTPDIADAPDMIWPAGKKPKKEVEA